MYLNARIESVSSGKLLATKLLHIPYSKMLVHPKGRTQAYELKSPGYAVRQIRLNIILICSGKVVVEIFVSDRVNPLQQNCILALSRQASTAFVSV